MDMEIRHLEVTGLEVMELSDAAALPETGASSGITPCTYCSTCGSSSCCASCQ
ncbi:thiazolylpeptide-type bacteriocin [Staphylospora marina]|uniref:thiazolylpeptide-type bacteriocin n=1 Tax=Staphylospora marina TaxID=2490858 RepID=UPI000F5B9AB2|nr:thiazolylpeptide-type bacteriocin [Staphylospora marina]